MALPGSEWIVCNELPEVGVCSRDPALVRVGPFLRDRVRKDHRTRQRGERFIARQAVVRRLGKKPAVAPFERWRAGYAALRRR